MDSAKYISKVMFKGELDRWSYLSKIPAVKYLVEFGELSFSSNITFLVGENGTGKSTLLEAIAVACGFNAEGGTKNFMFSTQDTHSDLHEHLTIVKRGYPKDGFFLRAESFYNAASYIDNFPDLSYGKMDMHEQSHGESFLSLVQNRFGGNGLYLLDEPECALSTQRLFVLMQEIHELAKNGSQFIIATHSPILMSIPNSDVFELSANGINKVEFKQTEQYRLNKLFYENPERMIHLLFDEK